jgi:hypothetical protein
MEAEAAGFCLGGRKIMEEAPGPGKAAESQNPFENWLKSQDSFNNSAQIALHYARFG